MQSNVEVEMWKVNILLGVYPAKIEEYRCIKLRPDIIKLFDTIFSVSYLQVNIDDVKNNLISYPYLVNQICDKLFKRKNSKKKIKTKIVYEKNTKLKWEFEEDGYELVIKIPNEQF